MSLDHSTNVLGVAQIKSSINLQGMNISQLKMVHQHTICKLQMFEASPCLIHEFIQTKLP